MRYVKKFVDPESLLDDDDRVHGRPVRFRRRGAPMSPRVTRKIAKIDATTVTTTRDDAFIEVRASWLVPPPSEGGSRFRSLRSSEPDPFTLRPPTYSVVPR